ncbi:hypothetical protein D9M68_967370 [compost metagenome]
MLRLSMRMMKRKNRFIFSDSAKGTSGGPEIEISFPPGFNTFTDFASVLASWLFSTRS